MSDLNINFNFLGPLPENITNKLNFNKVPDYKVRNALSEQENKLVRLAQHQLNLVEQEREQERQAAKQRQLQIIMRRRKEQRQQELERQRKQQQLNKPHNHIKEDDGPEL